MLLIQFQKVCFSKRIYVYRDVSTDDLEQYEDLYVGAPRLIPKDFWYFPVTAVSADNDDIYVEVCELGEV